MADPSQVYTSSDLMVDNITADQPGLRGRLVQRVAWRRTNESHAEARSIIDRQTQTEIRREFEATVDTYLADLNDQLKTTRQMARLAGKDSKLKMRIVGEQRDCVALFLAPADAENVTLPELDAPRATAEVWIKRPSLPATPALPAPVTTLLAGHVPALGSVVATMPLLKLPASSDSESIAYRTVGDWTVIGVSNADPEVQRRKVAPPPRRLVAAEGASAR